MAVVIETTIGDFTVDLYTRARPQTCRNFLKLCKVKYYNWSLFFTVQSNFIAQTGDPTATGKGGESAYGLVLGEKARYYEAERLPKLKHDRVGLLSMVNCGNNMLGSQFFITLGSNLQSLDGEHCVFGEITDGLEIILKFNDVISDAQHRPYQDVRISHTVILEDPYDDMEGLEIPDKSPEPTKEVLLSDRIGADEAIDDTEGLTMEEITEMQKEKEAKARATILEIVGDIPDADMAPPENVLFVCKLNPATNDDDLEIIFGRFGKIIGCEIIRDKQTGDSLQYAFIEFADRKSCENAYFSMDNVLIDDRRIHVDFSQSVSKLRNMRWYGKGKGIKYFNDGEKNKNKDKLQGDKRNKRERYRSRSLSPRDRKYDSKNGRDNIRDYKNRQPRSRSPSKGRQRKRSRSKETRDRSRSRNRRGRSKSKSRSRERRGRSRSRGRRGKSRSASQEKNWKTDKASQKNYDRYDLDGKRKKISDERDSSGERIDRYSSSKKRKKSKDRSTERRGKSDSKHKHKHKSR